MKQRKCAMDPGKSDIQFLVLVFDLQKSLLSGTHRYLSITGAL